MAGISLQQAVVTNTGFEHDRRWMLIDENNRFISQREANEMALMKIAVAEDGLAVTYKQERMLVPFNNGPNTDKGRTTVTVWDDTCGAEYVNPVVDQWFSDILGLKCRLVYMPDDVKRIVDQRYAPEHSVTSFSDAYPYMIIGQASLDDLNSRLDESLPMNRFRPNIVFTGGLPFEEDLMANITIGSINFYGVKLCARCIMTTINQDNASRGKEPLKTLASYRQKNNKIYFGQNLIHEGSGIISVGDTLEVLELNREERFMVPLI